MNDDAFLRAIAALPGDRGPQLVYADWLQEGGQWAAAEAIRLDPGFLFGGFGGFGDGFDGDGGGFGGFGDGFDGDGGGGGFGFGGGGGGFGDGFDGDGGGGGFGDGFDGGGGGGGFGGKHILESLMARDGFYIATIPSGYNPYIVIAWFHFDGLEAEMHGVRVIRRLGSSKSISQLAVEGPAGTTELLKASAVEYEWRTNLRRLTPADPKAWAKHCPRPKSFAGAS